MHEPNLARIRKVVKRLTRTVKVNTSEEPTVKGQVVTTSMREQLLQGTARLVGHAAANGSARVPLNVPDVLQVNRDRLRARADVELFVNVPDVRVDRRVADLQ